MISLNGNSNIPQPATLKEEYIQVMVDKTNIYGLQNRIWLAQKMQVTFTLQAVDQAAYNQITSYIAGGNEISYANTASGFNFSGFATSEAATYMKGASMLRDMSVTILER